VLGRKKHVMVGSCVVGGQSEGCVRVGAKQAQGGSQQVCGGLGFDPNSAVPDGGMAACLVVRHPVLQLLPAA
jgi:hypothetical protein